jgi:hypothetical protein
MSSFLVKANEQGVVYLLEQLSFQMGQRDLFQAEKTLSKLSKVSPDNLIYLQENIRFLVESSRFSEASIALMKIQTRISKSDYNVLSQLLDIYYKKRELLSEARLLSKRKLYTQALEKYKKLFQSKDPHYSLALEYWDIITEVTPDLEPTVLYKLERLNKQYPANIRIRLAYFKYSLRAGKNKQQIYDDLYLLTFNTVWKSEAKRLWQYGLLNTDVTVHNQQQFLYYMELFPNDTRVSYHYQEGSDAIALHKNLMRDSAYRAKLRLPKMLDDDAPLTEIALTLASAKTKYADDQVVIISEGQYLFRKNDYVGAKTAFKRCAELFTPTPSKCTSLLNTTNYWALIDNVELNLAEQKFDQAQTNINKLYTFIDESNYHILLDGRLSALLGNYIKAEKLYFSLLEFEPLNRQYLSTIMNFKGDYLGKLNMDTWISSLSLEQTTLILADYHSLLIARIREKADARLLEGNEKKAESLLLSALEIIQMHPWASYDLANLYIDQGNIEKALSLYNPMSAKVEIKYSYSLILSSLDMYSRALRVLSSVPIASRTESINKDIQRYQFEVAMLDVDRAMQQDRLALLISAEDKFNSNTIYVDRVQQQMLKYGFLEQTALLANSRLKSTFVSDSEKRVELLLQLAQVQLLSKQTNKAVNTVSQVYALEGRLLTTNIKLPNNIKLAELSLELLEDNQLPPLLEQKLTQLLTTHTIKYPNVVDVWSQNLRLAEFTSDSTKAWQALTKLVKLEPSQSYRFYQLFNLFEDHNDELNVSDRQFKSNYLIPFIQSFPFNPVGYDVASRLYSRLPELNEDSNSLVKKGYYTALMTDVGDAADFDIRELTDKNELLIKANVSGLKQTQKNKLEQYFNKMNSDERVSSIEVSQGSWLVNRFQSVLKERSLTQSRRLELGIKQYSKSGDEGLSEYDLSVLSFAYVAPMDNSWLGTGQWYVKVDPTIIKAGTLDVDAESSDVFGSIKLCDDRCDNLKVKQEEIGTSIALGFKNESVTADIGTKPIGFNLFDWVGGVNYRNSIWNIGWSLGASKRAVTSSLLSFSGVDDPYSSFTWGGDSIYNLGLSLSYDQGNGWGIWGLTDSGVISGEQTKSNARTRAMAGIYWDWFNRDWLNASIGLNIFTWQYQYDLSEYTLGQGGYYSPQEYKSASIPINFYGRIADFSYQIDLSISRSESRDDDMDYYPYHPNYQKALERFSGDKFSGGESTGQGHSINAMIEYKLTNHWTLGANVTLQQSEFFSPNSLYFYVKYYLEPNLQPANIRPDPVSIYMDY